MATFYISGNFYATQEYSYLDEVEAETLEEALEIHKEELTKGKWPNVEADQVDRPFNISGKFTVYPDEQTREDWDTEQALVEDEEFEGRM
jgi:hypothetical protein